ncbi:hypothetical protein [Latilactobacillus curvatus]|uniref:hypothetical protein n=1 Tax=Latilactobacillus curvatus TaxID=28038 RepID=UPI0020A57794|nr:hypothetical protein [Latilactobacillus curvatus]UTC13409.1 hypothetical protein A4W75_10510 [Latilactobacillus curvatus]
MSENQATWNWLVNLNVDGVVTNYPALGRHYQAAQDQAESEAIDTIGQVNDVQDLPTVENPYEPTLNKKPAKAAISTTSPKPLQLPIKLTTALH